MWERNCVRIAYANDAVYMIHKEDKDAVRAWFLFRLFGCKVLKPLLYCLFCPMQRVLMPLRCRGLYPDGMPDKTAILRKRRDDSVRGSNPLPVSGLTQLVRVCPLVSKELLRFNSSPWKDLSRLYVKTMEAKNVPQWGMKTHFLFAASDLPAAKGIPLLWNLPYSFSSWKFTPDKLLQNLTFAPQAGCGHFWWKSSDYKSLKIKIKKRGY